MNSIDIGHWSLKNQSDRELKHIYTDSNLFVPQGKLEK
jgi:hypothetical protein